MLHGFLVMDLQGTRLTPEECELLNAPAVAGLILFARNFESREQITGLIAQARSANPDLLVMTDHEGGRVQRFQDNGFTRLPAMGKLGRLYEKDAGRARQLTHSLGWLVAQELGSAGIDLSLSPVLDLDRGRSRVIGDRSFSGQTEIITRLASAFMAGLHEGGMCAVGKHFPGHGGVVLDSHIGLPVDKRLAAELEEDIAPYQQLIPAGLGAVMPAHVTFPCVDDQPAGFSHYWLQQKLRTELGFQGAVISDCLSMAGASVGGTAEERVAAALAAGCDLTLLCNDREAVSRVIAMYPEGSKNAERYQRLQALRRNTSECAGWPELENSPRRLEIARELNGL